ncbi:MAG: carboxypeptidase regulatory-like domain-containing protein [Deltaproteobacteria bacterium]|nr:carboxypeptidase regulatory-like domain-containing protein [Deltaproteobacteria bacterium]
MKKWTLIIDVAKCHDCNNCFLACKDEFYENDFPPFSLAQPRHGQRWMDILIKERGQYPKVDVSYLPKPCMHCDDAPCIKAANDGAVYKREDGIVIIDPVKAKGHKDLVKSCPYGAIWWNEEKNVPQKCTLCVHLLEEGWKEPRCVQACPTGALKVLYMEDTELEQIVKEEGLEVYHPEFQAKPRVYYKNLYRFTKCFIAGSVAFQDTDECAEGAKVTLYQDSKQIAETVTDNYGDFKFDDLEDNAHYEVEVAYSGYEEKSLTVELKESMNVGTIFL